MEVHYEHAKYKSERANIALLLRSKAVLKMNHPCCRTVMIMVVHVFRNCTETYSSPLLGRETRTGYMMEHQTEYKALCGRSKSHTAVNISR